jgi:ubiquinone/menaquinone biosynthesis C-methylase UbiE
MFGKNGPTLFELLYQSLCSTQRGYDLLAPKFDATPFRTPDEILVPALNAVGTVGSALDLCCGTGAAMRVMRPQCTKRLVGIDFSHGMIEQARIRLADTEGTAPIELVEADIFEHQFCEEFDLVTCFGALGHVQPGEERRFLQLVRRALKPGGRFVFATGYPPPWYSVQGVSLRAFNSIMRARNAVLKPPFIMYYLTFLLSEVEDDLKAEGFRAEIRTGLFAPPLERFRLVIATRS